MGMILEILMDSLLGAILITGLVTIMIASAGDEAFVMLAVI